MGSRNSDGILLLIFKRPYASPGQHSVFWFLKRKTSTKYNFLFVYLNFYLTAKITSLPRLQSSLLRMNYLHRTVYIPAILRTVTL